MISSIASFVSSRRPGLAGTDTPAPSPAPVDRCLSTPELPRALASPRPPGAERRKGVLGREIGLPLGPARPDEVGGDCFGGDLDPFGDAPAVGGELLVHEELLVAAGEPHGEHAAVDHEIVVQGDGAERAEGLLTGVLLVVGVVVRVGRGGVGRHMVEAGELRAGDPT